MASIPPLFRWLLAAALILVGLVLFFCYAPSSRPVAPPAVQEGA